MAREDDLLKRIRQSEHGCIDALVALVYPGVLRYCLWHSQNRQNAEDAAQETFLRVFRHFDWCSGSKAKFMAFLYQVARNVCVDMGRRHREESLTDEMAAGVADGQPVFDHAESKTDFDRLLEGLVPEQREVVLLRYAHDLTLRQIAEVMGLPLRTIQSRLRAAHKRIREKLEEER